MKKKAIINNKRDNVPAIAPLMVGSRQMHKGEEHVGLSKRAIVRYKRDNVPGKAPWRIEWKR